MSCRRVSIIKLAAVVSGLALLTACPFTPDYPVNLIVSPSPLDFGATATVMHLSVAKVFTSRVMQPFVATSVTPWISFTPDTGVSSGPTDPIILTVTIDRTQLVEGENDGLISIACPNVDTKQIQVKAEVVFPRPHAAFSADATRVVLGDVVQFTDQSEPPTGQPVTSWVWNFGDGSTSALPNPTHQYATPGTYDVSLFVATPGGNDAAVKTGYISAFAPTPLDTIVRTPDKNYTFSIRNSQNVNGTAVSVLNMTSQQWRASTEVDKPIWTHWLAIVEPPNVKVNTALLFITGGDNTDAAPDATVLEPLITLANQLGAVVALLEQVPSEPLLFVDESKPRTEDAILAYSFDKFMTTGDNTWPALFPMAKSAVAAMDTIQTVVVAKDAKVFAPVSHFILAGASKRGWTTWLASITDPRVVGAVPMVIDVLNMQQQMIHQFEAYDRYSEAVQDYVDLNIFGRFNTQPGQNLLALVDPFSYLPRVNFPKLLINSTGDQFFLPDSAQFYFSSLPGVNYLRYIPNTDHSLTGDTQVLEDTVPYLQALINGVKTPVFSWVVRADGAIVVTTVTKPSAVKLWQATNPTTRDFRLETIGPAWTSTDLSAQADGTFVGQVPTPAAPGFTAYMVELTFPTGGDTPYVFTTEVRVNPPTLPFGPPAR